MIVQSYEEGYSQHMIAKVLDVAQSAINGIIKRYG
jgi:predicted transcriptional regulator